MNFMDRTFFEREAMTMRMMRVTMNRRMRKVCSDSGNHPLPEADDARGSETHGLVGAGAVHCDASPDSLLWSLSAEHGLLIVMSASTETTEWDDILTKFGIKSAAQEERRTEKKPVQEQPDDELDDDDDEEVFRRYREMRITEMINVTAKPVFAEVEEISGQDFVDKVTKAGQNVTVVIHLYKPGVVTCSLINQLLPQLAVRFRETKFLKSISSLCIANFPDENLPGLLIYRNGKCLKQIFGPHHFPSNLKEQDLEWMLHKAKAIISDMEQDPRTQKERGGKFFQTLAQSDDSDDDEEN